MSYGYDLKMLETMIRSLPKMPLKSKQPEGNCHATQLCSKASYLMLHVHSTDGCIKWEKTGIH